MRFDLSIGDVVYSQRDNALHPNGACGATSAVNALNISNIPYDFDYEGQPEDAIMDYLDSKEGWALLKKLDPGATYNPWNTSAIISQVVNILVGQNVVKVEKLTLQEMVFHLAVKQAAIVIGAGWTKSSHFVTVCGFETDQNDILKVSKLEQIDLKKIKSMIIADSWGDYMSGYTTHDEHKGSITTIPIKKFKEIVFTDVKKTCQTYYKNLV